MKTAILPVDYDAAGPALDAACEDFAPDVAVHFGLARGVHGFRLERLARNAVTAARPDNAGRVASGPIVPDAGDAASQLPLQAIHDALCDHGMVVQWSDDAGGYLCNAVFYLSCSGYCAPLAGARSGFIHIGLTAEDGGPADFARADLLAGALRIIETCCAEELPRRQT